jgi:putative PIN family toxin of toxin-antitoxin system
LDDVLGRPRIRRWSQLPPNEVREFLSTLIDVAELYEVATTSQPLSRDPDDDFIIQTAIQGRAEVICTKDNDLLASEVVEFLAPRGIRVLTAVELLRELRPDPT